MIKLSVRTKLHIDVSLIMAYNVVHEMQGFLTPFVTFQGFKNECTHILAKKPSRSEKFLGACVKGSIYCY